MAEDRKHGETEYRFFIDKTGNWFQDGIRIRHRGTYLYNNRLLDMDEEGRFFVDEGSGRLYVEVEDTPYVVKMVYRRGEEFYLRLNDETEEILDLGSLRLTAENVPYANVKNKRFEARLSRPACYELMKYAEKEGDCYSIETGGVRHVIKKV
ncbi:MAG: hypothetical protein A3J42_04335 [Candidatus Dadabacteria bacterium RIFCSPHIGHO2_12_FULL_53_21]|nr:MAG: hypothetical protein A3J42_04335 [Candidatus Dadabacteria bacterium RIFCSPHIGHO2_12_FULL_53_21]